MVWAGNEPAGGALPRLGWLVFALVQLQGLLGGLVVVLFKDQIGVVHAALAQIFFMLLCVIAVLASRWWREGVEGRGAKVEKTQPGAQFTQGTRAFSLLSLAAMLLILTQLILGA